MTTSAPLPPYDRASDEAQGYDDGRNSRPRALYQSANYRRGYDRGLGDWIRARAAARAADATIDIFYAGKSFEADNTYQEEDAR